MDVETAFTVAENKLAWDQARQQMFKAFDMGKMFQMPDHIIIATAQDAYFNQNGVHADATIRAYFEEWKAQA